MFDNWKARRSEKRKAKQDRQKAKEAACQDAYYQRLRNSRSGYCGHRHSGEGPFLNIGEVTGLIAEEMERIENQHKEAQCAKLK